MSFALEDMIQAALVHRDGLDPTEANLRKAQAINKTLEVGLQRGLLNWVKRALAEGADPNAMFTNANGITDSAMSLAYHAHSNGDEILLEMLRAGGSPNAKAVLGGTVFLNACRTGDAIAAHRMLQASTVPVDVMFMNQSGMTAAMFATKSAEEFGVSGFQAIQDHFERHVWKNGHAAVGESGHGLSRSHLWTMRSNGTDTMNDCAIHMAAQWDTTGTALRWMLDHPELSLKHQIEVRGHGGATPLWAAVDYMNLEAVKLLLAHGARIDIGSESNQSLMQRAGSRSGKKDGKEIFRLLTAHQASRVATAAVDDLLRSQASPRQRPLHGGSHT